MFYKKKSVQSLVGSKKSYGYNENNLLTSNESSGIVKLLVSFNDDDDYKGKDFIQTHDLPHFRQAH
jgi:hypothetical protein